jgi:hypothetical protein
MMMDMVATSNRAFWQLGDQLHVGPATRAARHQLDEQIP